MAVAPRGGGPFVVAGTGHPINALLTGVYSPVKDDLIVVFHGNDYYALSNMNVPTVGGVAMTPVTNGSADAGNPNAHTIAYVYVVTASGDVTVQATETGSHDEDKVLSVWVLSGADLVAPIDGGSAGAAGSFSSTAQSSFVFTGVTPASTSGYLIYHMNSGGGSSAGPPFGTPSGMTQAYSAATGGISYTGGYQQLAASGATGTRTVTSGAGSVSWSGVMLAIKAASGSAVTFTDTSGGTTAGSTADPLSNTYVDTSGGATGGSTGDGLARTFVDGSGGSTAAGNDGGLTRVFADPSGGAAAGGTSDGLARTFVDASGGSTAGSTADGAAGDVVFVDVPGAAVAAGSADVLVRDLVTADSSGGVVAAGAADTLVTPKIYTDTSGGAAAAGSPDPIASTAVEDGMIMPILDQLLGCAQAQLELTASPPASYQIRPGLDVDNQADQYGRDECCAGLVVVTWASNYEGDDQAWIEPAGLPDNCPPLSWAVVVRIDVLRCVPVAGDRRGSNVTADQFRAAAQAQLDDAAALRRALCCMRDAYGASNVAAGQVNPLPPSGGCAGVTLQMTVRADACDCVSP